MSTPPGAGPSDAKEAKDDRRKSLTKYVKRMSSVFRREKKTKTAPSTSPDAASASTPRLEEQQEATTAPTTTPAPKTTPTPATTATATATATAEPKPAAAAATTTQELNRSALQQERARALFAKYGLTLESHEWISAPAHPITVQRVEKPIRMRVHRTCHRCGTTYGGDKVCAKCEHKRCKKCPRFPKKKTPVEKGKEPEEGLVKPKKKKLLTLTSKTGGELVYRHTKQRVRRTCHKCQNVFVPSSATICEHCRHIRCTRCPREPAKLDKWPQGYPGDVDPASDTELDQDLEESKRMWRRPRTRVRWECEECHNLFIEGSSQCPGCGHGKCEKCIRKPLKRAKADRKYDPEVVKAVEAKLRAFQIDDDSPAPV
ncbi:hypothetical protein CC80DRAFT_223817 [Byssothecium circinans]|uniref:Uncharacterized protein n=1 Tax=Byssothecium circinans TaxID=147558 RepID=A0A6A5TGH9_9PLEO|nr:hypothetical protein CC80DRAFT_295161 [Byssothecium circinans]KAF1950869.1 hypothetical protein CC80DRAFT_223817 [Byssothecium circinans]